MLHSNRQELIEHLADQLIELSASTKPSKNRQYYLCNIDHPVMAYLYKRYKSKHRIPDFAPLSDKERYVMELSLLTKQALELLESLLNGTSEK